MANFEQPPTDTLESLQEKLAEECKRSDFYATQAGQVRLSLEMSRTYTAVCHLTERRIKRLRKDIKREKKRLKREAKRLAQAEQPEGE